MGMLILGEGTELSDVWKCVVEGADKREPRSSQWGPVAGQEAQSEIWQIPFKHREKKYCEGGEVLEQVT